MNVAAFDFCDTIVDFQTADAYVKFAMNELCIKPQLTLLRIAKRLDKVTKGKLYLYKKLLLLHLRGQTKGVLDNIAYKYYVEIIQNHYQHKVLQILKDAVVRGDEVVLLSGGYEIYLKYFSKDYNIKYLFAGRLRFKKDIFTGVLDNKECMGREKAIILQQLFPNVTESVAYSDSKSDIPMLNWAKKGVVISKTKHRIWTNENGLEEIVLSKYK